MPIIMKTLSYDLLEISPERFVEECAWAAGLWDGEGCTNNNESNIRMSIGQAIDKHNPSDNPPRVLIRFQSIVKVGNIGGPYKDVKTDKYNRRLKYQWRCHGYDCARVAELLYKYWDNEKRTQYDICFNECMPCKKHIRNPLVCKRGHLKNRQNGYYDGKGKWYCRTCYNISQNIRRSK